MAVKIPTPIGDRVLVEPGKVENRHGTIIIPDGAKEKPQTGKVLAVGKGKYENDKLIPLEVKKGDKIVYSKFGGSEITIEGKTYLIIRESEILVIL